MTPANKIVLVATTVIASGALAACGGPKSVDRRASVPADGISSVRIIAENGDLAVNGQAAASAITLTGTAVATASGQVDNIDFATRTEGSELIIEARTAGTTARFNIAITVPVSMSVKIEDGDGNIAVQGVADLDVVDGSGDIAVRQVGALAITDTSGGIVVGPMTGNVTIRDDGMGDMSFRDITGDLVITRDTSGEIEIIGVRGNVEIFADADGDIVANEITGNFTVRYDSSGRIRQTNVGGTVSLPAR
ncbi:MAG: hypothetical protein IT535_13240 [Bauldia sp.]|nr:hypothetical protein [Bauldia sp.]